jgi:hypothetical protein
MDWNLRPTWAQGVAGSNPAAPTTSLSNLSKVQNDRELADHTATLAICHASPRIAGFASKWSQKWLQRNHSQVMQIMGRLSESRRQKRPHAGTCGRARRFTCSILETMSRAIATTTRAI